MEYIAIPYNGGYIYYKNEDESLTTGVYERIMPLGIPNNFLEYEFGKYALEVQTAINKNDLNYIKEQEARQAERVNALMEAFANYERHFTEAEQSEIDRRDEEMQDAYSSTSMEELFSPTDAISKAYQQEFGTSLDANKADESDIHTYPENNEFKDANNDRLCGHKTPIATF